jgi:hypothetical protein
MMGKEINLFGAFSKFIEIIRNLVPEILGTDDWEREYFNTLKKNQQENWSNQRGDTDDPKYLIDFGNLQSFVLNKKEFLGRKYQIRRYNNLPTMFDQISIARNDLMHFMPFDQIKADTAYLQMIQIAQYFQLDELEDSLKNLKNNTFKKETITAIQKEESNKRISISSETLRIELNPSGIDEFKRLLLINRRAFITTHYNNQEPIRKEWNANNMTENSNIIGNLRSRPEFRARNWQKNNISHVCVSIEED